MRHFLATRPTRSTDRQGAAELLCVSPLAMRELPATLPGKGRYAPTIAHRKAAFRMASPLRHDRASKGDRRGAQRSSRRRARRIPESEAPPVPPTRNNRKYAEPEAHTHRPSEEANIQRWAPDALALAPGRLAKQVRPAACTDRRLRCARRSIRLHMSARKIGHATAPRARARRSAPRARARRSTPAAGNGREAIFPSLWNWPSHACGRAPNQKSSIMRRAAGGEPPHNPQPPVGESCHAATGQRAQSASRLTRMSPSANAD